MGRVFKGGENNQHTLWVGDKVGNHGVAYAILGWLVGSLAPDRLTKPLTKGTNDAVARIIHAKYSQFNGSM